MLLTRSGVQRLRAVLTQPSPPATNESPRSSSSSSSSSSPSKKKNAAVSLSLANSTSARPNATSAAAALAPPSDKLPIFLQVLDVFRYPTEDSLPVADDPNHYDLILSDGAYITKCSLARTLNHLVHKGAILKFSVISITGAKQHFDERDLQGSSCILVTACETQVEEQAVIKATPATQLKFVNDATEREMSFAPLLSSSALYISPYNSDCHILNDPAWAPRDIDYAPDKSVEGDVIEIILTNPVSRPQSTIIGRVTKKSQINYYGKAGHRQKYPVCFYIELGDDTSTVPVVFWNSMCVRYFHSISVGDVLVVSEFRLNPAYGDLFPGASVELSINSSGPASKVYRLIPGAHFDSTSYSGDDAFPPLMAVRPVLPRECFPLMAGGTAEPKTFSVAGVIVFVGRKERVRTVNRFAEHRWLELVDTTCFSPDEEQDKANGEEGEGKDEDEDTHSKPRQTILVRLGTCSQPEFFENVAVGQVVLLSELELRTTEVLDSRSKREFYCISTRNSCYYALPTAAQVTAASESASQALAHALGDKSYRFSERASAISKSASSSAKGDANANANANANTTLVKQTLLAKAAASSAAFPMITHRSQLREYLHTETVASLLSWVNASSANMIHLAQWFTFGGFFTYPHYPPDYESFQYPRNSLFVHPTVESGEKVGATVADLHIHELVRCVFQGKIVLIELHSSINAADLLRNEKERRVFRNASIQIKGKSTLASKRPVASLLGGDGESDESAAHENKRRRHSRSASEAAEKKGASKSQSRAASKANGASQFGNGLDSSPPAPGMESFVVFDRRSDVTVPPDTTVVHYPSVVDMPRSALRPTVDLPYYWKLKVVALNNSAVFDLVIPPNRDDVYEDNESLMTDPLELLRSVFSNDPHLSGFLGDMSKNHISFEPWVAYLDALLPFRRAVFCTSFYRKSHSSVESVLEQVYFPPN